MASLLGIDFGTGGAKACLLAEDGTVAAYAYREYPISHPRPGWSEHDAPTYWTVTGELTREVLLRSGRRGDDVVGVGVSSALPSLVLVDDRDEPVAPALNLMDRRAVAEVADIRDRVGEETIERVTANRIEDHPTLVNLVWFVRNQPELYGRVASALTIDGFIAAKLTGERTLNRSAAVFYGVAFDIRAGEFREDVLATLELDPAVLPRLCDCAETIGAVTAAAAEHTGLVAGTPVVGGQVDCNAGWLAGGAIDAGAVQLNLGTSGVLGVVHRDEAYLGNPDGLRMVNIPYTTSPRDTWSAVAVTTTGGQALRYLRDLIGQPEVEAAGRLGLDPYDLLTQQAAKVPAGSDGLIALPYLMGERSPIWEARARGVLFGLSLHHERGHVIRAFMEGVAFALLHSFSILRRTGLTVDEPLVCNEGGARSRVWRRIVTDVFGMPSVVVRDRTGAPLGDAILAGVGVGTFDGFEVAKEIAAYDEPLEPDTAAHERYGELFEVYLELSERVAPTFVRLHELVRDES